MSNRRNPSVAIIGGGYAGMAAAVTLAEQGIRVTVFESAKQLGGRARGVWHNDTQLDNGQHLLLGCYRETLRLVKLVGGNIEQDFLRLPLQLDLHSQFELRAPHLPAPLHLLVALLSAKGISFSSRMAAARFMLAIRAKGFRLPQDLLVSELLNQHQQPAELIEKLWEPLCIAALNTPIQKASAQVLLNVLRDSLNQSRSDSDMLLPRIDFTALFPHRAALYIEQHKGIVLTSCGVEAIVPHRDEFEVICSQAWPDEAANHSTGLSKDDKQVAGYEFNRRSTQRFSHVICATSPSVAVKLLRPLPALADTVQQIVGLEQQPIYTVYLQYPSHVRLPHAMLGLHRRFSQWLFDKGQIARQHGLLAAVISAEGIHQELTQDQLAQNVIAELRDEFGITDTTLWFKVIAEKRATFCCSPNLQRPSQQTALPNLFLAGDYTMGEYPATLEGAVLSGSRCSTLIVNQ
jgi:squalene-associated FAD-dependent desaturase